MISTRVKACFQERLFLDTHKPFHANKPCNESQPLNHLPRRGKILSQAQDDGYSCQDEGVFTRDEGASAQSGEVCIRDAILLTQDLWSFVIPMQIGISCLYSEEDAESSSA